MIKKICKPWQDNGKWCYEIARGCMTCPLWFWGDKNENDVKEMS